MKHITTHIFTSEDEPWPKRIEQAFNRVINFAPELWEPGPDVTRAEYKRSRTPELVAFNRIATAGAFDDDDLLTLNAYAMLIFDRIQERYKDAGDDLKLIKDSCLQAGINVCQVMAEFSTWMGRCLVLPPAEPAEVE